MNRTFRARLKTERGFSMIEMLISMTVITVGLGSVISVAVYVSRSNTASNAMSVMTTAAQDQVDRLHAALWTSTSEDPAIMVGGSIPAISAAFPNPLTPGRDEYKASFAPASLAGAGQVIPIFFATASTSSAVYSYAIDPNNSHHATASNTAVGSLDIYWQVRQGPTVDIRYLTVKVVLTGGPDMLRNGYTVSTILTRG